MHRRICRNSHLFQLVLKSLRLLLPPAWDSRQCSGNTSQNLRPKFSAVNSCIKRQLRLTMNLDKPADVMLDCEQYPDHIEQYRNENSFFDKSKLNYIWYSIYVNHQLWQKVPRTFLVRPVISKLWLWSTLDYISERFIVNIKKIGQGI